MNSFYELYDGLSGEIDLLTLTILLFGSLVCGVIGLLIGRSVEKGGLGFLLGLVLGPIGWIIVLLLPRNDKDRLGQSGSMIDDPKNPDISFKDYKKQQKISRPGFSHMSAEEQKREWSDYVNSLAEDEAKRKKSKNSVSSNGPIAASGNIESGRSIEERLEELQTLVEKGLINQEEALTTKAKILNDL